MNFAQYSSMFQGCFKILSLFLILFSTPLQGQNVSELAGSWSGYISFNSQNLGINVTFSYSDDILDGTIDIPDQGVFTVPVEVLDTEENNLVFQFQTGSGPAVFYGVRNDLNDRIEGEFNQSGKSYSFRLTRNSFANGAGSGLPESEIIIPTNGAKIAGSLLFNQERSPLVILVSGSGSKTRNQEIGGFKTFQQLAANLYDEGYSTFRYDDRGIGKSTGNRDVTLQQMESDLVDMINYLITEYKSRISGVILFGHNQGGLIASMAVSEAPVDGLILAATPFLDAEMIITEQIRKISEVREISDKIVEQNLAFQSKVYEVVRKGSGWVDIESELAERLEAQIKELPVEHQNALGDMSAFIQSQVDRQLETAKSRWFKSWLETDPHTVMRSINVPALALFGEKDSQILPASNQKAADSLAAASGIPLQTAVIPEANHLFQEANSGMPMEYGLLEKEFTDGFINRIDRFIESILSNEPG